MLSSRNILRGCIRMVNDCVCHRTVAGTSTSTQPASTRYSRYLYSGDLPSLTVAHTGQWYEMQSDTIQQLQAHLHAPIKLRNDLKTFDSMWVMARVPLLSCISFVNQVHVNMPHLRLVLCGNYGTGRRTTIMQMAHYGVQRGMVVVYVPDVLRWTRGFQEISMSTYNTSRIDLPLEAVAFLQLFKLANGNLSEKLQALETTKEYQFTEIDSLEKGVSLMDLVDFGIARAKFASDCVGALFRELKHYASTDQLQLLVAIGAANSLFFRSNVKRSDMYYAPAQTLSLCHHLTRLITDDWYNGAVVAEIRSSEFRQAKDEGNAMIQETPKNLLGMDGIHAFDPFLVIPTANYSMKEARSTLQFMKFRGWLDPDANHGPFLNEIFPLTAGNPSMFDTYCATCW